VKKYARRAQLEIFEFDRETLNSDGVFRTNPRGWFTYGHAVLLLSLVTSGMVPGHSSGMYSLVLIRT